MNKKEAQKLFSIIGRIAVILEGEAYCHEIRNFNMVDYLETAEEVLDTSAPELKTLFSEAANTLSLAAKKFTNLSVLLQDTYDLDVYSSKLKL